MSKNKKTIMWFRQDLRLADNPALDDAAGRGPVIPVFILDTDSAGHGVRLPGGASSWWLHQSLERLRDALGGLVIEMGDPETILSEIAEAAGADRIAWNRCYEPGAIRRDTEIKKALGDGGMHVESFPGNVLQEPFTVETQNGDPYKVYSPFWRAIRDRQVDEALPAPEVTLADLKGLGRSLEELDLMPKRPNWARGWEAIWTPGEKGAMDRFNAFLKDGLEGYGKNRNRPDLPNVSRLSPHLHFGEIGARQIWHRTRKAAREDGRLEKDADKFLSELAWRDFSHHLLYHFPTLPEKNWKPEFEAYPWVEDAAALKAWQKGATGYPMVDAGMRQLWQTGYMHNRVRMIVASFLVKHLRIHWREGEAWFWDTLVDADLANNSASWQWVAGSGADASPYFRIFNPITQGEKFDPDGAYVRRWCPELEKLPDEHLHAPFEAPADVLEKAGIELGTDYPRPLVEHRKARQKALEGYEAVKDARADENT